MSKLSVAFSLLADVVSAFKCLGESDIDIVHISHDRAVISWGIAAFIRRIPVIWHVRWNRGNRFTDKLRLLIASKLILIAEETKSRFSDKPPAEEPYVIYNAVQATKWEACSNNEDFRKEFGVSQREYVIGFVGRIVPIKRLEWFLRVLNSLKHTGIPFLGVVVGGAGGEEEYVKRIEGLRHDLELEDQTRFLGYRTDVASLMPNFDVLLVPSDREPFGRVIIEAMAAGVPVIATNSGGPPEIIDNHVDGFLVDSDEWQEMATKLMELLTQPRLAKNIAEAAREKVNNRFSVERYGGEVLEVYEHLLNK